MAERREKMMAGEDAYLLPRDKGPVRRYVRDIVDARRNLLGLFMPAALGLIFVMLAVPSVRCSGCSRPPCSSWCSIMVIDGFFLGRKVNRLADEKFPDNTETGWKLGFYAASRASQLRRMRAPRPQVERGAESGDDFPAIPSPSAEAAAAARERHTRLTKPPGALGRLEDLSVWVAACQGVVRHGNSSARGWSCSPATTV